MNRVHCSNGLTGWVNLVVALHLRPVCRGGGEGLGGSIKPPPFGSWNSYGTYVHKWCGSEAFSFRVWFGRGQSHSWLIAHVGWETNMYGPKPHPFNWELNSLLLSRTLFHWGRVRAYYTYVCINWQTSSNSRVNWLISHMCCILRAVFKKLARVWFVELLCRRA